MGSSCPLSKGDGFTLQEKILSLKSNLLSKNFLHWGSAKGRGTGNTGVFILSIPGLWKSNGGMYDLLDFPPLLFGRFFFRLNQSPTDSPSKALGIGVCNQVPLKDSLHKIDGSSSFPDAQAKLLVGNSSTGVSNCGA